MAYDFLLQKEGEWYGDYILCIYFYERKRIDMELFKMNEEWQNKHI